MMSRQHLALHCHAAWANLISTLALLAFNRMSAPQPKAISNSNSKSSASNNRQF